MSVASASTLRPVLTNMSIAKSGQPYTFALVATGGTRPYRCAPKALGVGSLRLTAACVITGMAPIVRHESITGPFTFKLTDSSKPAKTIAFTGVNIVTKSAPITPQSFDGTYTVHVTGALTFTDPTGNTPPVTEPATGDGELKVVDGTVDGTLISISNEELGIGDVTPPPVNGQGIIMTYSYTFTLSPTGFDVSVTGVGSVSGDAARDSVTGSESVVGHRTSITP